MGVSNVGDYASVSPVLELEDAVIGGLLFIEPVFGVAVTVVDERSEHAVPDDEDAAVVLVEVFGSATVMDAVMGWGVEYEFDGPCEGAD